MTGLCFSSYFLVANRTPFDTVRLVRRPLTQPTGVAGFSSVEVPESWSDLAANIFASKYCRKTGVPQKGFEESVCQVIPRITQAIRQAGEANGYFHTPADAQRFEAELRYLLLHQMGAFNSPVWFNVGLKEAYDITGTRGNWYWDKAKQQALPTADAYSHPQASACFIQSVSDDLPGIFNLLASEARLFKYGSGTGTNFSSLRGKQEPLSGGGTSSGVLSFLAVFDQAAGVIKSGGTTRRAAKMVILDMDHPEILEFIRWKAHEEDKAKVLLKAGYSAGMAGEAYRSILGQNANHSVRLSDAFMEAYLAKKPWQTRFRTTGDVCDIYEAGFLMQEISKAAWACADPGVQFEDTINRWHTCLDTAPIRASNPCAEFLFLDDSACNLASLNLVTFLREDRTIDIEGFSQAVRIFLTAQEILVSMASYPTETIAKNSEAYRPLGLGYANLGAFLMQQGLAYDSDDARNWAASLTALMGGLAYQVSAELAVVKGSFHAYPHNKSSMQRVISQHVQAINTLASSTLNTSTALKKVITAASSTWEKAQSLGTQSGFRNAQVTVLAPTGTIGLLMDCDTTGIEPAYALVTWKTLADTGQTVQLVNGSVGKALHRLGYSNQQQSEITDYVRQHGTVEDCPQLKPEHLPVFDCALKPANGRRFISPQGHLHMMAAVQPFLSGGISKTVNLPETATTEDIENLYTQAWQLGLKGVALYRDNSKTTQALSLSDPDCNRCVD